MGRGMNVVTTESIYMMVSFHIEFNVYMLAVVLLPETSTIQKDFSKF